GQALRQRGRFGAGPPAGRRGAAGRGAGNRAPGGDAGADAAAAADPAAELRGLERATDQRRAGDASGARQRREVQGDPQAARAPERAGELRKKVSRKGATSAKEEQKRLSFSSFALVAPLREPSSIHPSALAPPPPCRCRTSARRAPSRRAAASPAPGTS